MCSSDLLAPPADPNAVVFATTSRSVWLGADSLLDVSGIAILDPLSAQVSDAEGNRRALRSGRILDGGTVTLSNDSGYVIALEGARIEASGASANFELLQTTGALTPNGRFSFAGSEQNVWSDGGDIRIADSRHGVEVVVAGHARELRDLVERGHPFSGTTLSPEGVLPAAVYRRPRGCRGGSGGAARPVDIVLGSSIM